jgi:hypothetical protein
LFCGFKWNWKIIQTCEYSSIPSSTCGERWGCNQRRDLTCGAKVPCRGHPARCGNGDWITPISCMINCESVLEDRVSVSLSLLLRLSSSSSSAHCWHCRREKFCLIKYTVVASHDAVNAMPATYRALLADWCCIILEEGWCKAPTIECRQHAAMRRMMCDVYVRWRDGAKKKMTF